MKLKISQDFKFLFGLIKIKGIHTQNEIFDSCGIKSPGNKIRKTFIELKEKYRIINEEGIKYTKFGEYRTYDIDKEKLVEFLETNEEIKKHMDLVEDVRSELW